ncbi:(2Fe-2S)-binding protein [Aquincola sp. MAHUQ-54]|uniref:(2Fe-2S)-binding protein n=1 Tax=Aquincola agrisoli TaxID=3119538 RepID=A0AAW9PZ08_9BURK
MPQAAPAHASAPPDIPERRVRLHINGTPQDVVVAPWVTLLDLLRDHLGLTGSKKGCDHGQCGACTVLRDGRRINACLALAVSLDGQAITTVEGLASPDGHLHPLQQAFIDHDAFQCGYCTPGQLCSAVGLLNEGGAATPEALRELMSGNLCRCGAYPQILKAVSTIALQPLAGDDEADAVLPLDPPEPVVAVADGATKVQA